MNLKGLELFSDLSKEMQTKIHIAPADIRLLRIYDQSSIKEYSISLITVFTIQKANFKIESPYFYTPERVACKLLCTWVELQFVASDNRKSTKISERKSESLLSFPDALHSFNADNLHEPEDKDIQNQFSWESECCTEA